MIFPLFVFERAEFAVANKLTLALILLFSKLGRSRCQFYIMFILFLKFRHC